ncbi:exo-alpha-sialidase [Anatilimnocola floriformis]|uniref:exo-alpha-sialidase n=1 Tax=Anatilimnocola floriformis TaxID=2948575 RepID=UPI0020C50ED0|nr:exo-alpha-sialidase [Anatilimnocola floriformis]
MRTAEEKNESRSDAYALTRHSPTKFYDGKTCWVHPRAGIVPGAGKDGVPRVVMTMNTLDVSGSDVFKAVLSMHTDDLGKTWTEPKPQASLAPITENIDGEDRPVALSDCWPTWHAASKTLLGTGHDVVYTKNWKVQSPRPRSTTYSIYDPAIDSWSKWQRMKLPGDQFADAGPGCVQRYDKEDGSILLPIYFRPAGKNSRVIVTCCRFDGKELAYQEHGNELSIDDATRGLHEPSLTRFQGEYFLTLRNDKLGFVSRSRDGLQFSPIQPWKFDDGTDLGNYNTQQHWVTHSDALYLVYTRKGANNDHVFRHRAPLFMAQVDPKTLRVIRATEQILIPERGARYGNFGVTQVSPHETWVTESEWMQTWPPNTIIPVDNKYGANGSVWVARIRWSKENKNFTNSERRPL